MPFFKSEPERRALLDEKEWRTGGLEEFKRNIHRSSDQMLDYEVAFYASELHAIRLAKEDPNQMRLSGGKHWVLWQEKKALVELQILNEERNRRGLPKQVQTRGIYTGTHAWELIRLRDIGIEAVAEILERWRL